MRNQNKKKKRLSSINYLRTVQKKYNFTTPGFHVEMSTCLLNCFNEVIGFNTKDVLCVLLNCYTHLQFITNYLETTFTLDYGFGGFVYPLLL